MADNKAVPKDLTKLTQIEVKDTSGLLRRFLIDLATRLANIEKSISTGGGGAGVTSFNSRSGVVLPQTGDYNTSQVTESVKLYFTNARAINALLGQDVSTFTNDIGYITIADLVPYLLSTTAAATYLSIVDAATLYYPLVSNPAGYLNIVPTLQEVTDQGDYTNHEVSVLALKTDTIKTALGASAYDTTNGILYSGGTQVLNGVLGYLVAGGSTSIDFASGLLNDLTSILAGNWTARTWNDYLGNAILQYYDSIKFTQLTTDGMLKVSGGDGTVSTATPGVDYSLPVAATLFNYFVDAGNGTTVETDLYSDTIAAAQLATNGDKLEAEYGGIYVSSATATRQIKIYFGGSVIFDTGALTLSLSSAWTAYVTIIRVNANTIRYMVSFTTEGAALAAYTNVGELTGLTLSATNILKITGQAAGIGAASNDIVAKLGQVKWVSN